MLYLPLCFPSTTTRSPTFIRQSFCSGLNIVEVFWARFSTGSFNMEIFVKLSFQNLLHGPHVHANGSCSASRYNIEIAQ